MYKNIKKERIIFKTDTGITVAVSSILKKYKLEESREVIREKIKSGKKLKTTTIIQGSRNLILKEISEDDFLLSLEKELETTKETAEKILEDIKNELLPLARKITPREEKKETEKTDAAVSLKPSVALGLEESEESILE